MSFAYQGNHRPVLAVQPLDLDRNPSRRCSFISSVHHQLIIKGISCEYSPAISKGQSQQSLVLSNPQRLLDVAINIPGSLGGRLKVSRQHIKPKDSIIEGRKYFQLVAKNHSIVHHSVHLNSKATSQHHPLSTSAKYRSTQCEIDKKNVQLNIRLAPHLTCPLSMYVLQSL